jgi:hypothetical protein
VGVLAVTFFGSLVVQGQKIDSYLNDVREALVPYGRLTAPNCHAVEIDLHGLWSNYAIPDGIDKEVANRHGRSLKWMYFDSTFDLAELDEDKVKNHPIFSLDYIGKHESGTKYAADTPAVMLFSKSLNGKMTVHTVDLDKVHSVTSQKDITEQQMGM